MIRRLLIANRGEIAIRIARTAAEMAIEAVTIFSEDDALSLHTRHGDEARSLDGSGPAAYLNGEQIVRVARDSGCDAIHPGYGFLAESAAFARACTGAEMTFVGPRSDILELFGDKVAARSHARRCGVPVLAGTDKATSIDEAKEFLAGLGEGQSAMLKARAGGGGRGMRIVRSVDEMEEAFVRCEAEARHSFGDGGLFLERLLERARHIEVQIVGDGSGAVSHLWERECSLQRHRQKLVEFAPAEPLDPVLRERLLEAAVRIGSEANYHGLGTIEFLVASETDEFAFIEANPRLQVEHTVTEEVTGLDLVRIQLELAGRRSLAELGLLQPEISRPRGTGLQARINLETMVGDGTALPSSGMIETYEPPSGRGLRVDGFGYSGYRTSLRFDSLLAKLIVHVPDGGFAAAAAKARRALGEFRVEGVSTNIGFLRAVLSDPAVLAGGAHTGLIEERAPDLAAAIEPPSRASESARSREDPLAVLHHGRTPPGAARVDPPIEPGLVPVCAPMPGLVVSVNVTRGDAVRPGQEIILLEAMKMHHPVRAASGGIVGHVSVHPQETVAEGQVLLVLKPTEMAGDAEAEEQPIELDRIRPDLAEVLDRHAGTMDPARPEAVARRRRTGQRTARENIEALVDPGSFVEYGSLVVAGRSRRNTMEELIERSPADGLIMGLATVNGERFGEKRSRVAAMAYDYTVFAGTQGARNHIKTDRMVELADRWAIPLILFAEGGGGRPGDTDGGGFIRAFEYFGRLSGRVPLVGIVSGRCFAGNASLLGCCDVVIATENVTIGMGGPAMIEGGGLGTYRPEQVGPASVHARNGVIDLLVADEAEAVHAARQYLSYFQGTLPDWECADQHLLRHAVPEDRLRVYDVRQVIETLADTDSVLELRRGFGPGMITALARIEGRPVGIIANNPHHLGGAIDSDAADKAARFMQICEAFDLPLVMLSDTPGIMVGPDAEKTALVRHSSRMFVIGANLSVPIFSVILRKSYGLGAIAMTGGSYQASVFSVSWPTGEFGGMGLEGAVKLGYRSELEAIEDPAARKAQFDEMVARAYQFGKALTTATYFGIDDVIDPAETRCWIAAGLRAVPDSPPRASKKLRWIDTW